MDLVLFFIIRKMLYKIIKFLLKSGSRLHTFSYKTCFNRLYSLNNGDLTYSIRKLALIIRFPDLFCIFEYPLCLWFFFIVKKLKLKNAYIEYFDWFQSLKYISDLFNSFNFYFQIFTSVGSCLDKIIHPF